ncbi:glycine zipper 2TM domain-containing protein [Chitinimonas sp. BJYL2]|uniref:glycine zipper 2TM domain-containing protein n=1 Tax=Chitinimonas sp. BJYL2 TaxID=2976696 RepID=UPI0022B4E382|nr:glycine zipper 2TM domain-containing protein [Chitinimonas sp. BJYL2]
MNKSMMMGAMIGGAAVLSFGAVAGYQTLKGPDYAEVLSVTAAHKEVKTPEQQCEQVQVVQKAPVKDEHRVAGTVIGGLVGGLLGNQVGGGNGKKLATAAGVAGGAYAGNQMQKNLQNKDTVTRTEQRCKTVTRTREELVGYDVRYRLDGKEATVRMDLPPTSDRIPVKDGQLELSAVTPAKPQA